MRFYSGNIFLPTLTLKAGQFWTCHGNPGISHCEVGSLVAQLKTKKINKQSFHLAVSALPLIYYIHIIEEQSLQNSLI